ncbi:MAG: bifunctional DNA primase/polymerase [Solirubrobacterales bacterium]
MDTTGYAIAYASRGWKIFPLRPKTKEPFEGIGVYQASSDEKQIRTWWKKHPNANIGLHCGGSGLIAIDLDSYKDHFADINLCETVTSLTGNGGEHRIYLMPEGKRYGGKTGGLARQNIDVRGWGGYIVLPPSTHPNGREYAWEIEFSPDETEVAPLPEHIKELLDNAYVEQQTTAQIFAGCDVSLSAPDLRGYKLKGAILELIHSAPDGDRSQIDAKIVTALINAGASNGDILNVYSHYPCGNDGKFAQRGQSYLAQTIRNARTFTGIFEPGHYPGFGAEIPEMWEREAAVEVLPALTVTDIIEAFALQLGRYSLCELDDRIYLNGKPASDPELAPVELMVHNWNGALDRKSDNPYLPVGAVKPVILSIANKNRFHPVRDWLPTLKWDGMSHVHTLASHFLDNHPKINATGRSYSVFETLLSHWLIGSVDRAFTGAQNPILVLAGGQGLGKSFLPGWLARPLALANGYKGKENPFYCEGNINPDSIEHQKRLAQKFIWEIGEVGATMRKADMDALKQFITEGATTFRTPYTKYDVTKPALCNWIATVNPTVGFLNDPTGNRRFRTVEIKSISWGYSDTIDAEQIWAQAYYWWKERGWTADLDPAERAVVEGINANHSATDDETEAIMAMYEFNPTAAEPSWSVYTADVVADLIENVPACRNTNVQRVGRALSRLTGQPSRRLKAQGFDGRSGYHGVRKMDTVAAANRSTRDLTWYEGI